MYDQGRKALSASGDKTLRVWDLASGQTLSTLQGQKGKVTCCTVYEQGGKALSEALDETRVWDLASGQTLSMLRGHTSNVCGCVVYDQDRSLRVRDLATGQSLYTLRGHQHVVNRCAVFDRENYLSSPSLGETVAIMREHTCRRLRVRPFFRTNRVAYLFWVIVIRSSVVSQ
jgi:WD40 repeat protein